MKQIKAYIDIPPSVNSMYFNVLHKGRVKSQKYKTWLAKNLINLYEQKIPKKKIKIAKIIIRLAKPNKNSDLDNRIKALLDLLEKYQLLTNDNAIQHIDISWLNDKKEKSYFIVECLDEL